MKIMSRTLPNSKNILEGSREIHSRFSHLFYVFLLYAKVFKVAPASELRRHCLINLWDTEGEYI